VFVFGWVFANFGDLEVSGDRRYCFFCWIDNRGVFWGVSHFAGFLVFQQDRVDSVAS